MTQHLTDADILAYQERSLDPARLLVVDDHVADCRECQARMAGSSDSEPAIRFLQSTLRPRHLEYEQLEAYAGGRPMDAEARAHLDDCPACQKEAADLRAFAGTTRIAKRRPVWQWGAAAVAVAAALWITVQLTTRPPPSSAPAVQIAQVSKPSAPPEYQALVDSAIASGKLDFPAGIAALAGQRHQLMGAPDTAPKFGLVSPLGTATVTDRPEFRWAPLAGARSYRVSVYDAKYNQVVQSPVLTGTTWQASQPLDRSKVYSWQVTAIASGREVTAPQPPFPEAKFTILAPAEAARLEAVRAKYPTAHLALGVLLAQAGALSDAASELKQAIASGEKPDDARKLLQSLPPSVT